MNTPEERNANHPSVDAQSADSVDTGTPVVPEEITELRGLLETAVANTAMADESAQAAAVAASEARTRQDAAHAAAVVAYEAEDAARRDYLAALRRHGYVQTADGPKPRQPEICPRHGFVHGTMPSADYGADCNGPKSRQP